MNEKSGFCLLCCPRCMGHGHFVIPTKGEQFEVFSRVDAHHQLRTLLRKRLISNNQFSALSTQVDDSVLPLFSPHDVEEFIRAFCETESWAVCFSRREEEDMPKKITIDSDELALAVHEYLLASPEHALHLH